MDDFLYERTSLFELQFQVMVNKSMPTVTRDPLNPLEPSTSGNQVRPFKTCKIFCYYEIANKFTML